MFTIKKHIKKIIKKITKNKINIKTINFCAILYKLSTLYKLSANVLRLQEVANFVTA